MIITLIAKMTTAMILILLGGATIPTDAHPNLRTLSSSTSKDDVTTTRSLVEYQNPFNCPNIANGDKKPKSRDKCNLGGTKNNEPCMYDPHRCSDESEVIYTYGCECMFGEFMCFSHGMIPCELELPLTDIDEGENTMSIIPIVESKGTTSDDNDNVTIIPYESEHVEGEPDSLPPASACPAEEPLKNSPCSKADLPTHCDYEQIDCPSDPMLSYYKHRCYCEEDDGFICVLNTGTFSCGDDTTETCVDCGDVPKSVKGRKELCSTFNEKRLNRNCQKGPWIKEMWCANSCIAAGATNGREHCCGASPATNN